VTIYTGGNIDTSGNSNTGINNIARFAPCFTIYGLSTCTSVKLGGQPTITATIYAPQANLDLTGGGGGGNAVGAFFCRSVTMTGNFAFHYDEALQLISPSRGYIAAGWQEVY
jgi:choice-of-anchor A domain-containing protein